MICIGIDTETTGLEQAAGHRIIEICASIYDVQSPSQYRLVKTWTQRINPLREIDKGAQAVHGISLFDLKDEPEWEEVAPVVRKILGLADLVVAHNAAFDMPFIVHELIRVKLDVPDFNVYCTMEHGRNTTPYGKLPNLGEFCFAYGINYDATEAHSAEYDVGVMMQAFFNGLKGGQIEVEGLATADASI